MLLSLFVSIIIVGVQVAAFNSHAALNKIVDLYNQKKFVELYNLQGPPGKRAHSKSNFTSSLNSIFLEYGEIIAHINFGQIHRESGLLIHAGSVCFNKTLGFQILYIATKYNNIAIISIQPPPYSTIRQYSQESTNNSATIFINEKKVFESNGNVFRPVGTGMSQIIVGLEYANQVLAGKLNPSTIVSIKEIRKYLIPEFDKGEKDIIYTKRTNYTLQKVVQKYLESKSYAFGEYVMDLLGMDNLKKLLVDLDVNQTNMYYPTSFYLAMTAIDKKTVNINKYISQLNQSYLEERILYIHNQLKLNFKNSSIWLVRFTQRIYEEKQVCDLFGKYQQHSTTNSYASLANQILGFNLSLSSGQDPAKVLAFYYATVFPSRYFQFDSSLISDFSTIHYSSQGIHFKGSKNLYVNLCGQLDFRKLQLNISQVVICLFSTGLNGQNFEEHLINIELQYVFLAYSQNYRKEFLNKLNIAVESPPA